VFDKILFPTDFSEWAEETAKRLPEVPGAREVVVLHVIESGEGGTTFLRPNQRALSPEEYARAKLTSLKEQLHNSGLAISLRVMEPHNTVPETILSVAREEKVSLIVMSARKKGLFSKILLGSVSATVLLKSRIHVLITQYPDNQEDIPPLFSRLLLPVDLSRPSKATLSLISGIGDLRDVIILHVLPQNRHGDFDRVDGALQEMIQGLHDKGISGRRIIRYGPPSEEICKVGEMEKASLIIMSRFGRTDYIRDVLLGKTSADVGQCAQRPVLILYPQLDLHIETRELLPEEFDIAESVWQYYHQLKADRDHDRIFCVFVEGIPVAVARCKRHPDGLEVDGIFTLDEFRNHGYARMAMRILVDTFKNQTLYMHSTLELVDFYRSFGFQSIAEKDLPPHIRDRFSFAEGNLKGVNVCPMKRVPASGQ
jgi:nucleotide-binding universal stress UspA family protein/GNAT superfamily N-acetyltransferase